MTVSTICCYVNYQTLPLVKPKRFGLNIQELFIEKSFHTQLADHRYFHRYSLGDVVVLVGNSTAGKTSIIKALRQLEPDRVEDGIDLTSERIILEHFKNQCPDEVKMLETVVEPLDIPKAVLYPDRSWKTTAFALEKVEAEKVIQRIKKMVGSTLPSQMISLFKNRESRMFDHVFEHSRRGGRVIFDVLNVNLITDHILLRNFKGPIRIVLVYCPFRLLSSRIEKRNKEAVESCNLKNQRMGQFPLMQFSKIYTQKTNDQRTWEVITRKRAVNGFNQHFDNEIINNRSAGKELRSEEQIHRDRAQLRQLFLSNLGFAKGMDKVEIAPRDERSYHFFLNSGVLKATESAKILHYMNHH